MSPTSGIWLVDDWKILCIPLDHTAFHVHCTEPFPCQGCSGRAAPVARTTICNNRPRFVRNQFIDTLLKFLQGNQNGILQVAGFTTVFIRGANVKQ